MNLVLGGWGWVEIQVKGGMDFAALVPEKKQKKQKTEVGFENQDAWQK